MTVAFNEPRFAIEPSDYRCASCAAEVAVRSAFFSAIFFEGESLRRRSYCAACWSGPPQALPQAYASWRSLRPRPDAAPRKVRFDPDLVLEFFRRLGQEPAPALEGQKARLRLVLALLLLRRKLLVFESAATREGREWLKLSEKADPSRIHHVENPPSSDAELEEVKGTMGELLQMDL